MNTNQLAGIIDSAIRLLYNSKRQTFTEIFGENAEHLWYKFTDHFDANEGSFICSLDQENQAKLASAVLQYAKKNDPRFGEFG